ncbi:hypothetical protein MMC21_006520 [Puttea exsequens]|nr:hypothetical protein [Puttea exsequens]
MAGDPDIDTPAPWLRHDNNYQNYPYSPSTASTASSSSASVFSLDGPSSQSSVSSSSGDWPSSRWIDVNENPYQSGYNSRRGSSSDEEVVITTYNSYERSGAQPSTETVAPESRKHPRRTQRLDSCESEDGKTITGCPRPPPSLVRQSERKDNFVDSLVDTTTQMIETIWPLSVLSCNNRDSILSGKQQNLIGLRTFVQEVLRRSKTSYSTLQVALYYLILIQSCIPKHDFTMEQSEDSSSCRAMQCGRRMFLAALILASKYLQDRNYSARAWSKISGLKASEINSNEMAFLSAIDWKLHIPEPVFSRWTAIVLKFSPSSQLNMPRSSVTLPCTWKSLILQLTPGLDGFAVSSADLMDDSKYKSPASAMSPPPIPTRENVSPSSPSDEPTPTNPFAIPRTLEPTPRDTSVDANILPLRPHPGPLPTPQMTPQIGAFCTPAVSASGLGPGKPSMCYAMTQIHKGSMARSTLDNPHSWKPNAPAPFPRPERRSSLAQSTSTFSSPESMVSDVTSRSSRSSSISSVASSNCALPPPRLAVQATRRCANMQLCGRKEACETAAMIYDTNPWEELIGRQKLPGYEDGFQRPVTAVEERRWGGLTSSPQSISGTPTQHNASTREAAAALHDLELSRHCLAPTPQPTPRPQTSRKRSRPQSIDLSVQACVRDEIAPRCLDDVTNMQQRNNENDSIVLRDAKVADSFLVLKTENAKPVLNTVDVNFLNSCKEKPATSRDGLPRKRACAGSDRGGRDEARMVQKLMKEKMLDGMKGPGMWDGII